MYRNIVNAQQHVQEDNMNEGLANMDPRKR